MKRAGYMEQVRLLFDENSTSCVNKYAPNGHLTSRLTLPTADVGYHIPTGSTSLTLAAEKLDLCHIACGFRL